MHAEHTCFIAKGDHWFILERKCKRISERLGNRVDEFYWRNFLGCPESEIDSITALSGSGPAYFFLMEQMVEAGLELGLSKELSENLAKATAVGAAEMALASSAPLTELRQKYLTWWHH